MIRGIASLGFVGSVALSGCGLATLTHDSLIGPVSPIGRIHELTVGSDFHVTEQGPMAQIGDEPRLRPYPRDLIRRLASPDSFWSLAQGIEAFVTSISPLATRETRVGNGAGERIPDALRPGVGVEVALSLLGPPDVWVRRSGGSFMLYREQSRRAWSFYLGVPPPAAALVPIPGIANLRFRYVSERERASKLMLFFDERDVLVGTSASADGSEQSE